jgi:hypothetical protein
VFQNDLNSTLLSSVIMQQNLLAGRKDKLFTLETWPLPINFHRIIINHPKFEIFGIRPNWICQSKLLSQLWRVNNCVPHSSIRNALLVSVNNILYNSYRTLTLVYMIMSDNGEFMYVLVRCMWVTRNEFRPADHVNESKNVTARSKNPSELTMWLIYQRAYRNHGNCLLFTFSLSRRRKKSFRFFFMGSGRCHVSWTTLHRKILKRQSIGKKNKNLLKYFGVHFWCCGQSRAKNA